MTNPILRSQTKGCFTPYFNRAWGGCFSKVQDPDPQITDKDADKFHIIPDFPKIPLNLWSRVVELYFHYAAKKSSLEVSVVLLRNENDLSQWKIVVPEQEVSSAHVAANFKKCVDIETGEEYNYPEDLKGWSHCGSKAHVKAIKLLETGL